MIGKLPFRENDSWGSGAFGARRGANRTHRGVDVACYKGTGVHSCCAGQVTKIGYPYDPNDEKKGHLRYVEITTKKGERARYFYVKASVKIGQEIEKDQLIGVTQGLDDVYKGITDHFHFEIIYNGEYLNPHEFLKCHS
jgi:murein DD-endopeptidase MepM/ murein hydrolase activator NlpD